MVDSDSDDSATTLGNSSPRKRSAAATRTKVEEPNHDDTDDCQSIDLLLTQDEWSSDDDDEEEEDNDKDFLGRSSSSKKATVTPSVSSDKSSQTPPKTKKQDDGSIDTTPSTANRVGSGSNLSPLVSPATRTLDALSQQSFSQDLRYDMSQLETDAASVQRMQNNDSSSPQRKQAASTKADGKSTSKKAPTKAKDSKKSTTATTTATMTTSSSKTTTGAAKKTAKPLGKASANEEKKPCQGQGQPKAKGPSKESSSNMAQSSKGTPSSKPATIQTSQAQNAPSTVASTVTPQRTTAGQQQQLQQPSTRATMNGPGMSAAAKPRPPAAPQAQPLQQSLQQRPPAGQQPPPQAGQQPPPQDNDDDNVVELGTLQLHHYNIRHIIIEENGSLGCTIAKSEPPGDLMEGATKQYTRVKEAQPDKLGYTKGLRDNDWFLADSSAEQLGAYDDIIDSLRSQKRPLNLYVARHKNVPEVDVRPNPVAAKASLPSSLKTTISQKAAAEEKQQHTPELFGRGSTGTGLEQTVRRLSEATTSNPPPNAAVPAIASVSPAEEHVAPPQQKPPPQASTAAQQNKPASTSTSTSRSDNQSRKEKKKAEKAQKEKRRIDALLDADSSDSEEEDDEPSSSIVLPHGEKVVPFCKLCNHPNNKKKSTRAVHHALCPQNDCFDNSNADEILQNIIEGMNKGCQLCREAYGSGKAPTKSNGHNFLCPNWRPATQKEKQSSNSKATKMSTNSTKPAEKEEATAKEKQTNEEDHKGKGGMNKEAKSTTPNRYSNDFKVKVLDELEASNLTVAEFARSQNDLPESTLRGWIKAKAPASKPDGKKKSTSEPAASKKHNTSSAVAAKDKPQTKAKERSKATSTKKRNTTTAGAEPSKKHRANIVGDNTESPAPNSRQSGSHPGNAGHLSSRKTGTQPSGVHHSASPLPQSAPQGGQSTQVLARATAVPAWDCQNNPGRALEQSQMQQGPQQEQHAVHLNQIGATEQHTNSMAPPANHYTTHSSHRAETPVNHQTQASPALMNFASANTNHGLHRRSTCAAAASASIMGIANGGREATARPSPRDKAPCKSKWIRCEHNPWGPDGHSECDVVVLTPARALGHYEVELPSRRYEMNPFSDSAGYQKTHATPEEGFHMIRLQRDAMAMRPWGFSVQLHDFGGACLVESVDPTSPAAAASFVAGMANVGNTSALRVNDMIIAVNGKDVGGMTEVGMELELNTSGPILSLVVSRYQYPDHLAQQLSEAEENVIAAMDSALNDDRIIGWVDVGDFSFSMSMPSIATQTIDNQLQPHREAPPDTNTATGQPSHASHDNTIARHQTALESPPELSDHVGNPLGSGDSMDASNPTTIFDTREDTTACNGVMQKNISNNLSISHYDHHESDPPPAVNEIPQEQDGSGLSGVAGLTDPKAPTPASAFPPPFQSACHENPPEASLERTVRFVETAVRKNALVEQTETSPETLVTDASFARAPVVSQEEEESQKSASTEEHQGGELCIVDMETEEKGDPEGLVGTHLHSHHQEVAVGDEFGHEADDEDEPEPENGHQADDDEEEEDWEDDVKPELGCICGTTHHARCTVFWIQCGTCEAWYSAAPKCLGFSEAEAASKQFSCWGCCPPESDDGDGVSDEEDDDGSEEEETSQEETLQVKRARPRSVASRSRPLDEAFVPTSTSSPRYVPRKRARTIEEDPERRVCDPDQYYEKGTLVNVHREGSRKWGGDGNVVDTHIDEDGDRRYKVKYVIEGYTEGNIHQRYVTLFD